MNIEVGKKYISNGRGTTILCLNRPNCDYPVIGMQDDGTLMFYKEDGSSYLGKSYNLVEEKEELKEDDLCLFWNDTTKDLAIHIGLFTGMQDRFYSSADGYIWSKCTKINDELKELLRKSIEEIK
jgi:hypothetical protein